MSDSNSATLEPPVTEPVRHRVASKVDPKNKPKRQPPYAVIVENDDDHTFQYVIDGLCRICGHGWLKSFKLAVEIHKSGRASVWTGSLEVAELKRDQIKALGPDAWATKPVTYPLGVRLEPLPQ